MRTEQLRLKFHVDGLNCKRMESLDGKMHAVLKLWWVCVAITGSVGKYCKIK